MVWDAWDAWDVHVLHSHSAWLTGGCSCKPQWSLPLQLSVPALKRPRGRQLWPWCRTSVWRGWESPWPLAETWWSRGRRWGCWLLEGVLVFNLKEGWGRVIQKLDRKICWFQPRKPQKRIFSAIWQPHSHLPRATYNALLSTFGPNWSEALHTLLGYRSVPVTIHCQLDERYMPYRSYRPLCADTVWYSRRTLHSAGRDAQKLSGNQIGNVTPQSFDVKIIYSWIYLVEFPMRG